TNLRNPRRAHAPDAVDVERRARGDGLTVIGRQVITAATTELTAAALLERVEARLFGHVEADGVHVAAAAVVIGDEAVALLTTALVEDDPSELGAAPALEQPVLLAGVGRRTL